MSPQSTVVVRTTYFGGIGPVADPDPADVVLGVVRKPHSFVEDVVDRNVPEVAPPDDLLHAVKRVEKAAEADGVPNPREVAWSSTSFAESYQRFLERTGVKDAIRDLREEAVDGAGDLWLVCYERDPAWCHRRLLADAIVDDVPLARVHHHPEPGVDADAGDAGGSGVPGDAALTDFQGESA